MTAEEFNNTGWTGGMIAIYKEKEYNIVAVDFEEMIVAIDELDDVDDPQWKRCENLDIKRNA